MMATEARPLFDFYFRYKWNEVDFADWQDTMIGTMRDTFGAIFGPALIAGGAVAPSGSTRAVTVAAYETVNEDGYLCVRNSTVLASVTANSSGQARKDLIVSRPLLTNQTTITRPTSPFDTVPFHVGQDTEIVVIPGTPAGSPVYPAKVDGDVIIAGLAVANGATSFSSGNIDNTVTEVLSGNTNFADWVVGKDVHGTAAITGDASSTRAALVATGGNGEAGGDFTGAGDGTGSDDNAVVLNQNLKFAGSDPSNSTGFLNVLTPKNVPKAWGRVAGHGASAPTVTSGFNITASRTSNSIIKIDFVTDLALSTHCVVISANVGLGVYFWVITVRNTGDFSVELRDAGNNPISTDGADLDFVVFGVQ
jgi:hypothetical protein